MHVSMVCGTSLMLRPAGPPQMRAAGPRPSRSPCWLSAGAFPSDNVRAEPGLTLACARLVATVPSVPARRMRRQRPRVDRRPAECQSPKGALQGLPRKAAMASARHQSMGATPHAPAVPPRRRALRLTRRSGGGAVRRRRRRRRVAPARRLRQDLHRRAQAYWAPRRHRLGHKPGLPTSAKALDDYGGGLFKPEQADHAGAVRPGARRAGRPPERRGAADRAARRAGERPLLHATSRSPST